VKRALAVVLTGLALALLPASPAAAHPLGNFTVNTADRLVVTAAGVEVVHVVDLAEIPTVQLRPKVAAAGGLPSYVLEECGRVAPLLSLRVDERPVTLVVRKATGTTVPGAAGLDTTRLECRLTTGARPARSVAFVDGAVDQRVGWKEVSLASRCGSLRDSDVPGESPSGLLTSYPSGLLSSPLDVRSAQALVTPGACAAGDPASDAVLTALPRGVSGVTAFFTDFLGRKDLSVGFGLLAVLASVAFGVVHALAPGHGKTVMAAYLVGQRGTRRQALQLGSIVTFTHTASVLLLGGLLTLGTLAAPERVVPVTEVLSGLLLAALGAYLLTTAVRRSRTARQHQHDHDHHHEHAHEHSHGGVTHSHAELPEGRLGWRSLAGMGVAGGLVPSPSALVVLLGATALGRAWFGVLLVLCYGIGMAITLTAAGMLLLRAQGVIERRGWTLRRGRDLSRLLPVATASVVVLVGLGLVARGVMTTRTLL
jgi:ABC-type nickel/cobalt efflux system permease component RcnA